MVRQASLLTLRTIFPFNFTNELFMPLNLCYVPHNGDNHGAIFSRNVRAQQAKINAPIGGKNLAVLCFTGDWFTGEQVIIGCSSPEDQVHSEKVALDHLEAVVSAGGTAQIRWLYTERAPCGRGAGMKDCHSYLEKYFSTYSSYKACGKGKLSAFAGAATPVFFSYQYPSSGASEVNACVNSAKAVGVTDEPDCLTLKEYFRQVGKEDRSAVTACLKEFDKK